jgi:TamB, inner membrane protein subunit of TAM complex
LSVCSIPAIGYLLVQNNKVQNYLANTIAGKLSGFLGTKVKVGYVHFDMLNRLVIKNLYVEDLRHDTLLFSNKLTLSVGSLSISKKSIRIERIELSKASINFYIDSAKVLNLQFIINKISGDTANKKKGWDIVFDNIGLTDSKFSLTNYYKNKIDTGINFTKLKLDSLNIRVKNLVTKNHITSLKINKLYFKEQSGFKIENLSAKMSICRYFMHFDNLKIFTAYSNIDAPKIYFDFSKINEFSNFAQKVNANYVFNSSTSSFSELAYFAHGLWGMNEKFEIEGTAKGKFSNLKCKKIKFSFGKNSSFEGDLSLTGLPQFKETYMFINVRKLNIFTSDIYQLYIPNVSGNRLNLPKQLEKIGNISYKGNFTGFVNDFVTYGTFTTDYGTIKSDISLKPESKTKIAFNGKISAIDVNVGKFLENEKVFGMANLNLTANGIIEDKKKVTGTFEGNVSQFDLYGYKYSDIFLKGSLQENAFDGSVKLEDPNAKLDLYGHFDLSKNIPEFNFSAKLFFAELHKLNILKKDSLFNVSCEVIARFKGNNIDNIEGNIQLKEAHLKKFNKEITINDLYLYSQHNQLSLKSDILDANISGEHDFNSLYPSLIKVVKYYMPSSFQKSKINEPLTLNKFKFDVAFKNIKSVCSFFIDSTDMASNSRLMGTFYPDDNLISFAFNSDFFQTGSKRFEGLCINGNTLKDSLKLALSCDKFKLGEQISFNHLIANSVVQHDSMLTNFAWSNMDTLKSRSNITFLTNFSKIKQAGSPALNIKLYPTQVYIIDSLWKIDESVVILDTSSVTVKYLKMSHNLQNIYAFGKISENVNDTMNFEFENFDLRNIGFFIKNNQIRFEGRLSGHANLSDFYHKNLITADLQINRFSFNGEQLGKMDVLVTWNSVQQKIIAEANAVKSDYRTLHATGEYFPYNNQLNFLFDIKKVSLTLLQPYLSNIFTLQNGSCTGHVELTGSTSKPYLNGTVDVDDAKFLINYLKTNYSFSTKLRIVDNNFVFANVKLADPYKNQCFVNGMITTNYLKNFNLNFNINLDNTLVLNTRADDNPYYYGVAYASGNVHISGLTQSINIDISHAVTGKNTAISIPLNNRGDVLENKLLTFNYKQNIINKNAIVKPQYDLIATGTTINIELELTPDAEIQLVFDPKVGDIMRSHGTGNISIEVNSLGNFLMRGDYTIQSGDYLFTLKNLINKKFILEPGGVISWNGNPMDANIDIKAVYKVRAALYNLLVTEQSPEFKKRIPIECQLYLKGKLLQPDIRNEIYLPNASEETRSSVRDAINTNEALSMQFFMLLVTNNFMPSTSSDRTSSSNSPTASGTLIGKEMATTTSYEMLSNQFSNWISQVSKDFDIGLSYRPGDKNITNEEVEVAMSTQLLNDRVSINGNLDVVGNQTNQVTTTNGNPNSNTKNLVGDVNVDVKLTENGKLMLKVFNRANDQITDESALYTQGIGLQYREEFSTFGELVRRYYHLLFGKKKIKTIKQPADTTKKSK